MPRTVSMRMPTGLHAAIKELAAKAKIDITDMATLLLYAGISHLKPGTLSEDAIALIQADSLEAQAQLLRALAGLPKNQREKAMKEYAEVMQRFEDVVPLSNAS